MERLGKTSFIRLPGLMPQMPHECLTNASNASWKAGGKRTNARLVEPLLYFAKRLTTAHCGALRNSSNDSKALLNKLLGQ